MRRPAPKSWMLTTVLCVLAAPLLIDAQVPTNRPLHPGEQWVRLFNGKDLTNWVEVGKEKWTVEDGTIHGQGVTNAYGYLRTEKKYKAFRSRSIGPSTTTTRACTATGVSGSPGPRPNTNRCCARPTGTTCS